MKSKEALLTLAALAQESRLAVFRHLIAAGPEGVPAGAIAEKLKLAAPTLSFHLKELERAGLIDAKKSGRSIVYSANARRMRALLSYLMEDCCGGRPEICDLKPETMTA
jgi:DNA-binding transcriptional ArsR family regulator